MSQDIYLTGITTTGTPHIGNYVGAIWPGIEANLGPHHADSFARKEFVHQDALMGLIMEIGAKDVNGGVSAFGSAVSTEDITREAEVGDKKATAVTTSSHENH